MRKLSIIFVLFTFCHLLVPSQCRRKSKAVTTLIDAKWYQTPLVLEIVEFLADENLNSFWAFVDEISSFQPPLSTLGITYI